MNSSVVNIFAGLLHLIILFNRTLAGELGNALCRYSGGTDVRNISCHSDTVDVATLPQECTSFVFDGVTCTSDLDILPNDSEKDLENLKSLIKEKPDNVFLFYQRSNQLEWEDAIFANDHSLEVQKVKSFVRKYPVAGLILCKFVFNDFDDEYFYKQLSAYVKAIKDTLDNFQIGFYFKATDMLDNYDQESTWFDFSKMDEIMDFYIIEFANFNLCTDDCLHSGITPVTSENSNLNTLTKFGVAYHSSLIEEDKVYFEFVINPIPKSTESTLHCEISYTEYCANERYYKPSWCVDDQDSLYEKGEYAKYHAKGIVARDIDLVDRDLKCQCNNDKYITFYMLLDAFEDKEKVTCDRFEPVLN